jgi:serine phosphatase RsbU (regulator of sigma subunit)
VYDVAEDVGRTILLKLSGTNMGHKNTLRKLLISGRLADLLGSMAGLGDQILQVLTSSGELLVRCNAEGKCLITEDDVTRFAGERVIPSLCVQRKCPYFKGQQFSTVNVNRDNIGLVIGCYDAPSDQNRAYIEFVSHVLSEIVTREEEILSVSSDILIKYEELSILYEVSRSIATSFSEVEVATLLVGMAAQALGLTEGAVFLVDPDDSRFRKTVSLSGERFNWDEVLAPEAEECFLPLFDSHTSFIDDGKAASLLLGIDDNKTLLVPLVHHSHIDGIAHLLGAMVLSGKKEGTFSLEDSHFMSTLTTQGALGIVNCRSVARLRENERLSRDLELGQSIQQSFFPDFAPKGDTFDLFGRCIPARRIGGDYFDYFTSSDGHVVIVIADVSGHNLGSAILMASIRSVLRTALKSGVSPIEVLKLANKTMYDDMSRTGSFVSVFIASFDPESRVVNCASAGHNPPLLILPSGENVIKCEDCKDRKTSSEDESILEDEGFLCPLTVPVDVEGLLIGVMPDYPFEEMTITLKPGSLLFMYTDGAIEAANDLGELFGMKRLSCLLYQNKDKSSEYICETVRKAVENHSSGSEQQDDLAMIALKVL